MNVLITGAGGQVATEIVRSAPPSARVQPVSHLQLDIADRVSVESVLRQSRPEIVFNLAAYTAVDQAEAEPEAAERVNAIGARNVAEACLGCGARMVHVSTDFVFDGQQSRPYVPTDVARPLNTYGLTKWNGEQAVRAVLGPNATILRTAWVYSTHGRNFMLTILRLLRERGMVRVVDDQIGSPTWARSVAQAIWALGVKGDAAGTFHWTDSGVASWYDFALAIAEEGVALGLLGQDVRVEPISTEEYPTPARRPAYCVLDKRSTTKALGITPRHWRESLRIALGGLSVA